MAQGVTLSEGGPVMAVGDMASDWRAWMGPGLGEVVGPAPGTAVGVRQGEWSAVSSQPVAPACMHVAQLSEVTVAARVAPHRALLCWAPAADGRSTVSLTFSVW